jgi:hypothetical protein
VDLLDERLIALHVIDLLTLDEHLAVEALRPRDFAERALERVDVDEAQLVRDDPEIAAGDEAERPRLDGADSPAPEDDGGALLVPRRELESSREPSISRVNQRMRQRSIGQLAGRGGGPRDECSKCRPAAISTSSWSLTRPSGGG